MKFRRRLEKLDRPSAVAIGNFDGFHAGHRQIVEILAAEAQRHRLASVVLTFQPHPRVFFRHPIQLTSSVFQHVATMIWPVPWQAEIDRFSLSVSLAATVSR